MFENTLEIGLTKMIKLRKLILLTLSGYVLILILASAFSLLSMKYDSLRKSSETFVKPVVAFHIDGQGVNVSQDLTSNGAVVPRDTRVVSWDITDWKQVDRLVFLLDGFESAIDNPLMRELNIDAKEISELKPSSRTRTVRVSLGVRLHPFPIFVERTNRIFINLRDLSASYREECLIDVIWEIALTDTTSTISDTCEL